MHGLQLLTNTAVLIFVLTAAILVQQTDCLTMSTSSNMISSKKLINTASAVVPDAVEGLLLTDSRLRRVSNLNIVVRRDIDSAKTKYVSIICGGGAGHEPAHAGFVGEGMLSAAVFGNVFASPSVSAILAAIRVCSGSKGVLLIVKNYTGDKLNFGMALEKAKQEKIDIKMVIVDDDCALPVGKGITGGRGVAGTVFVHKIAGAAAAAGCSLDEVYSEASNAVKLIGTLGIALTTCTLPGAPTSQRLAGPRTYEVGMGIHGEPGREQRELPDTDDAGTVVGDILCDGILGSEGYDAASASASASDSAVSKEGAVTYPPRLPVSPADEVVVLLNNLGALPAIEMLIVAKSVILNLRRRGLRPVRAFVGPYVTALDMTGVSLSILRVASPAVLARLDAATSAPAWVASSVLDKENASASDCIAYDENVLQTDIAGGFPCEDAIRVVRAVCQRIIDIEPTITEYDTICGDGDCGLVMKAGAIQIMSDLSHQQSACGADSAVLFDKLANSISASMGGTSGALLEIFFRAAATFFSTKGSKNESGKDYSDLWGSGMSEGLDAIKFYGGATVGMRTMLDALEPGVLALKAGCGLAKSCDAAVQGMESTKTMNSLAGRSNYVGQVQMNGIPDPGAAVVAEAFMVALATLS